MKSIFKRIQANWQSGLSVSLVSIPLAISLAVASNTKPVVGIITAIWAGLMASIFGSSSFNVIGPTGALSGILAAYAIKYGPEVLPVLAILSGIFIFIAYIFKLEKYLIFFPSSTIHGFVLGVAFIIILNQMNAAFGLSNIPLHENFLTNVLESFSHLNQAAPITFGFFALFLCMLFTLGKIIPNIPGAIILTPITIFIGYLSSSNIINFGLQTLESKYPDISPAIFLPPSFKFYPTLFVPAIAIAVISILETMISARIADGITKTKHNKNKEVFGLGLANIVSGLAGGIPATAALARTALNIKTGCSDKISATISSIFILIISLIFLNYFKYIPMAAIAAMLVFVSVKMVEKKHFARMFQADKKNFIISIFVAGVTICEDPIIGILFGATIAMLTFMVKMSQGQFELTLSTNHEKGISHSANERALNKITKESDTVIYSIKGQLAYINAQSHIARFEEKQGDYKNILLNLKDLYFIDLDGAEALSEIINILHAQNKNVFITNVSPFAEKILNESHEFKNLKKQGFVFENPNMALDYLKHQIA